MRQWVPEWVMGNSFSQQLTTTSTNYQFSAFFLSQLFGLEPITKNERLSINKNL